MTRKEFNCSPRDMAEINVMVAGIMGLDRCRMSQGEWKEAMNMLPFTRAEIRERAGLPAPEIRIEKSSEPVKQKIYFEDGTCMEGWSSAECAKAAKEAGQ